MHPCGLKSWLSPPGGTGPGRRLRFCPHCQWSALLTLVKFQGTKEACYCGKPQFFLFCLRLGPSQPPLFISEHQLIAPQSAVLASPSILVTTFCSLLWAFALAVCCLEISLTSLCLTVQQEFHVPGMPRYLLWTSQLILHLCGSGCSKRWAWAGALALSCLLRGGNSMAAKSSGPDSALTVSSRAQCLTSPGPHGYRGRGTCLFFP